MTWNDREKRITGVADVGLSDTYTWTPEERDRALSLLIQRITLLIGMFEQQAQQNVEGQPPAFRFPPATEAERRMIRKARSRLPDPRLIRKILRSRHLREQAIGKELFADPAWEMLLDLTAAREEGRRVQVTSLCIASGVPATTALRYIKMLEDEDLVERVPDATDRRRRWITLSDHGAEVMARYFELVARNGSAVL